MPGDDAGTRMQLIEAVSQAIRRSRPSDRTWLVCVRAPDDEQLISLELGSYGEVEQLAREIRSIGYHLKLMHPLHTNCDFLLEPDPPGRTSS
jgi:hypothetical protein